MGVFQGVAGNSSKTGTETGAQQLDPMGRAAVYSAAGQLSNAYTNTPFKQLNASKYFAPTPGQLTNSWNAAAGLKTPDQFNQAGDYYNSYGNASFGTDQVNQFMSPYQQAVTDATMQQMRNQHDQELAALGLRNVGGAGLGSSGYALGQALANRDYGQNAASTYAGLQQAGFQDAYKRFADSLDRRFNAAKGLESLGTSRNAADIDRIKMQMLAGNDRMAAAQRVYDLRLDEARKEREAPQLYATNFASGIAGLPWDKFTSGTATSSGKEIAPQGSIAGQVLGGATGVFGVYKMGRELGWW
jgi:hypothetical protein